MSIEGHIFGFHDFALLSMEKSDKRCQVMLLAWPIPYTTSLVQSEPCALQAPYIADDVAWWCSFSKLQHLAAKRGCQLLLMYLDLLPQWTVERIYGWLKGCEYPIKKFYKHKDTRQIILLVRETNLIATTLPRLVNTMQALYTTLVANLSSKNTNTSKTPFGRAPPASASLTHSLFMHYS
jgi:hypothetical protein